MGSAISKSGKRPAQSLVKSTIPVEFVDELGNEIRKKRSRKLPGGWTKESIARTREVHIKMAEREEGLPFEIVYRSFQVLIVEPGESQEIDFRVRDFEDWGSDTISVAREAIKNGMTLVFEVPRRFATQATCMLCRTINFPLMAWYDVVLNKLVVSHVDWEETHNRIIEKDEK